MKNLILILVTAVFALASKAQSNTEEITLLQSVYGMEKRDLIARHIKIEVAQSDLFWQLYDEYEIARKEIGIKRARNIKEYAKKYENLTNEDADALVKASMEVQKGFINLWDKTYKKMAISISPVTVAQFIQAEMFLENMIRQELSMDIPLIGEFEIQK
jgi:uroporphyrinogen-III synthase